MEIGLQASIDFAAPAESAISDLCEKSTVAIGQCRVFQTVIEQDVKVGLSPLHFKQDFAGKLTNAPLSFLIGGDHLD
jgi:hypothetical protein